MRVEFQNPGEATLYEWGKPKRLWRNPDGTWMYYDHGYPVTWLTQRRVDKRCWLTYPGPRRRPLAPPKF